MAAVGQRVAGVFPRRGQIEVQRGPGQHLDREAGVDQQFIMRALERQPGQRVAEHVQLIATRSRLRADLQLLIRAALPGT
ncbi:hypothetical protein D3C72_1954360 [compost metagenome]